MALHGHTPIQRKKIRKAVTKRKSTATRRKKK